MWVSDLVINNMPKECNKYVVARAADNAIWYWGSYKNRDRAEQVAKENGFMLFVKEHEA